MRWFQIGVVVLVCQFQLSSLGSNRARSQDRTTTKPPPGPRHAPQILFDVKVPEVGKLLSRFQAQPVQLQASAIDALRSGRLPSERTDPIKPTKIPFSDNGRSGRLSELGALEIYPSFKEIGEDARELDPNEVISKIRGALVNGLLPRDQLSDTELEYGRVVSRARSDSDQVQRKLLYVSARRTIKGIAVDGPGSRFSIAFDAQARVRGVVHDWSRIVSQTEPGAPRIAVPNAKDDIRKQISATLPRANVRVQRIDVVYYDPGGGEEITPAYRFVAEVQRTKKTQYTSEHLVGYVPLLDGKTLPRRLTTNLVDESAQTSITHSALSSSGTVLVGRFVARNDSAGFYTGAEDFLGALTSSPGQLTFVDAGGAIAATPAMFGADREKFVNSVDVALVEAHGTPLGFTTQRDTHDRVRIERDVQPPGLGSGSGGRLKHWIIHSCRVIPAPGDFKGQWAPLWKDVFNGLSSVVGYRTPMFIADGAEAALATSLRAGAAVVPAWFSAVNSLSIYGLDTLASFQCEDVGPVGRAAAVVACGNSDAAANEGAPVPTSCLEVWWVENELINLKAAGAVKP